LRKIQNVYINTILKHKLMHKTLILFSIGAFTSLKFYCMDFNKLIAKYINFVLSFVFSQLKLSNYSAITIMK